MGVSTGLALMKGVATDVLMGVATVVSMGVATGHKCCQGCFHRICHWCCHRCWHGIDKVVVRGVVMGAGPSLGIGRVGCGLGPPTNRGLPHFLLHLYESSNKQNCQESEHQPTSFSSYACNLWVVPCEWLMKVPLSIH